MCGKNLKGLRERAGMTQQEFAVSVGISLSSIQKYENAPSFNPSWNHLKGMAGVLAKKIPLTVNKVLTELDNDAFVLEVAA